MAPFDLSGLAGTFGYGLVFFALGMGFGVALEMSGFGDTRKLAAQFYLTEMTVLKVMFTAIVVACVLLFGASAFGLLDFDLVWVNPTYLWPGIVGGLIMGVGFIIGGFCPGTALVGAATLKIDGMMFVLGALFGVLLFGESVSGFETFWHSSYMGRFTLPEWLGLPAGVVVVAVVLMALMMFWAAELSERYFGRKMAWARIPKLPQGRGKIVGGGALLLLALVVAARGQPTAEERWARMAPKLETALAERAMLVHPAEVVALRQDPRLKVNVIDLREERDFNLFHLAGARRIEEGDVESRALREALRSQSATSVTFLVGNGEQAAMAAWKKLKALGAMNLYVIEGGINRWLELYPLEPCIAQRVAEAKGDELAYRFAYAVGSQVPSASPELAVSRSYRSCPEAGGRGEGLVQAGVRAVNWPEHAYQPKVELQVRKAVKGGCG